MTLPDLRACLDRLGVNLSVREGRLHYQAQPGAMPPEVKAALATHKAALLARLSGVESPAPWPPRPTELAGWPIPWRERWGRLANELQDQGVPWPDHERIAFDRLKAERQ